MSYLARTAIFLSIVFLMGLFMVIVARQARADIVDEIERAEVLFQIPWHVDTLTDADRAIERPVNAVSFMEHGKASWYKRTGRPTANGEAFPTAEPTCAHRYLPFHTRVRVTRVDTGRSIRCRINDRGPAKWTHKIIDLSPRAALGLGIVRNGVVKVRVEVLK